MTILWNGLRYRWRKTSHRLALLGTRFGDGRHELTLKIGAFPPDVARYTTWFTRLPEDPGDRVQVFTGVATGLRPSSIIGQTARATITVRVAADGLDLDGLGEPDVHGAALLGGFRVRSVGNTSGWHFGRLGIDVGLPRRAAGEGGIVFDIEVVLRPSEAPELIHLGNQGWSYDMPCTYDVEVDWVLVIGRPDALAVEPRAWTAEIHRALADERADELHVGCPPGVAAERCPAVGLRRFDVEVDAIVRQRRRSRILRYYTGRNIRELGIAVEVDHDDDSGVSLLRPSVRFSNKSALGFLLPLGIGAVLGSGVLGGLAIGGTPGWIVAAVALAVGSFGLALPGGPFALASVPWSLRAALDAVLLYLPEGVRAEAAQVEGVHDANEEPHASEAAL